MYVCVEYKKHSQLLSYSMYVSSDQYYRYSKMLSEEATRYSNVHINATAITTVNSLQLQTVSKTVPRSMVP